MPPWHDIVPAGAVALAACLALRRTRQAQQLEQARHAAATAHQRPCLPLLLPLPLLLVVVVACACACNGSSCAVLLPGMSEHGGYALL